MINVVTSHCHIWEPQEVAMEVIKAMLTTGRAEIYMNNEGPCADSVGLYRILDSITEKFEFDKKKICIITHNREENHPEYTVIKKPNFWARQTVLTSYQNGFKPKDFAGQKNINKNLFGCLYNIPSWDRLCLTSFIRYRTNKSSLLACNPTWEPFRPNSVYLNTVTDFCSTEFANIARLLIDGIDPLPGHPGGKPKAEEQTMVLKFYNDFFVDIVAETYTNGLTFFPTEKTFRPMYAHTPFVVFGPQGFLSTLKSDFGFQTFDAWWDESYDQYQNYQRIEMIYKVIEWLDQCSSSDLETMYQQMQSVLAHNCQQLQKIAGVNL
jgi:hypothetical protein